MSTVLSHKLAVLVFIENAAGEQLLIRRAKMPNLGNWSPIGGKVETGIGESPFECAVRETEEEADFKIATSDLHLFGMISEKAYEGQSHWLLFLFQCTKPIAHLPPTIDEGQFGFFSREAVNSLSLPETDRIALWPIYDKYHRDHFVALRADCKPGKPLLVEIEEVTPRSASTAKLG
jgi:8-oxo-dGTP diphosphatase